MTPSDAAAHVFVADLSVPELGDEDRHHLTRVLRLSAGATVTAADGSGSWRPCRLDGSGGLDPVGAPETEPRVGTPVTVAFALVKGQRPELVVQKLTELGVDRIVPFAAERSVVRWDPVRARRRLDRLVEIARQAAMQSRRCRLPAVGLSAADPDGSDPDGLDPADTGRNPRSVTGSALPDFGSVSHLDGASLADPSGGRPGPATSTVLVGPEGGWTSAEREAGLPRLRLGPHVLRAETAAITAGALLVALRSDILETSVPAQVAGLHRS